MKTAIFVDGQNFFYSLTRNLKTTRIDYNKFATYLVDWVNQGPSSISNYVGTHYYVSLTSDAPSTVLTFLTGLELQMGYFVHRAPRASRSITCQKCGNNNNYTVEKRVDTQLTADMIRLAAVGAYDVAVLVSGDADFIPAIDAVNALGKRAFVATWSERELSMELRKHCYGHISIQNGAAYFSLPEKENAV